MDNDSIMVDIITEIKSMKNETTNDVSEKATTLSYDEKVGKAYSKSFQHPEQPHHFRPARKRFEFFPLHVPSPKKTFYAILSMGLRIYQTTLKKLLDRISPSSYGETNLPK